MTVQDEVTDVLAKWLQDWAGDDPCPGAASGVPLHVAVLFTTVNGTLSALRAANVLSRGLNANVTLIVPRVVPRYIALPSSPIVMEIRDERFSAAARHLGVEILVRIYSCHDRVRMLRRVLEPNSLIVIGPDRLRWWPASNRVGRTLTGYGYQVVIIGRRFADFLKRFRR